MDNVQVVSKAISNEECEVDFFIDRNTGRTSSLLKNTFHPKGRFEMGNKRIQTITCDSISQHSVPDLIKCDIEGHEVAFLQGAIKTLKSMPIIMLEVQMKNADNVFKILVDADYAIFNAEEILTKNTKQIFRIDCANIIAIPKSRLGEL